MDGNRFDDALRQFATARRPFLGLGVGALLAVAGSHPGDAKKKRKKKRKKKGGTPKPQCVVDTDCATGLNCDGSGTCVCRAGGRCTGCCETATTCRPLASVTTAACGANGAACAACGDRLRCDATDGQCLCDAQSNPDGCCSADRRQGVPGISSVACGSGGAICQACDFNEACFDHVCDQV